MEDVRRAARRPAARGEVVITQKGRPADPADFRGPIRIARGGKVSQGLAPRRFQSLRKP